MIDLALNSILENQILYNDLNNNHMVSPFCLGLHVLLSLSVTESDTGKSPEALFSYFLQRCMKNFSHCFPTFTHSLFSGTLQMPIS